METEKAIKASNLITKIEKVESKISYFEKTREFSKISFSGENGAEQSFNFIFSYEDEETVLIRSYAKAILNGKLEKLKDELFQL